MPIDWNEISSNSNGGTELMLRNLEKRLDSKLLEQCQIVPSRVRELDESKIRILWLHDLPRDPESDKALQNGGWRRFHKIVAVSNWQMQAYQNHYQIPWSRFEVIQNAIEPIYDAAMFEKWNKPQTINLIYTSTPHRGLGLLIPVYKKLVEELDNIHLTVYSSFKLYGWDDRDREFEPLFDTLRNIPSITFHQGAPNGDVLKDVAKAHIFAYPSVWMETSCLCLMEAMASNCLCVHPNFGALYETAANWTMMYQWNEDHNRHAQQFFKILKLAILTAREPNQWFLEHLNRQQLYAETYYSWETRIHEWTELVENLLDQPREFEKDEDCFVYRA